MQSADIRNTRKSKKTVRKACLTFRSFVDDIWLPYLQKHLSSWQLSGNVAKNHLLPFFGDMPLNKIELRDIRIWQLELERRKFAPGTCNRIFFVLKSIFNLAVNNGLLEESPCQLAPVAKFERRTPQILPLKTVKLIYDSLIHSRNQEAKIILLMLYTGVSKSVIIKSRWNNVHLDENVLVHEADSGKASQILLPAEAVKLIRALPDDNSPYLFPGRDKNKPCSDIFIFWNELRQKCDCPNLLLRDMQQSYSHWKLRTGSPDLVMEKTDNELALV